MKKLVILVMVVLSIPTISMTPSACIRPIYKTIVPRPMKPLSAEPIVDSTLLLVNAMIMVESADNDSAYNAKEDAVGILQIRPIMVREVNRILKRQGDSRRFSLKSRWNRDSSLVMFDIWKQFHHSDSDIEVIARNWNGGPRGYDKPMTEGYWKKVQKHFDSNK